jgi:hypothetical protein
MLLLLLLFSYYYLFLSYTYDVNRDLFKRIYLVSYLSVNWMQPKTINSKGKLMSCTFIETNYTYVTQDNVDHSYLSSTVILYVNNTMMIVDGHIICCRCCCYYYFFETHSDSCISMCVQQKKKNISQLHSICVQRQIVNTNM